MASGVSDLSSGIEEQADGQGWRSGKGQDPCASAFSTVGWKVENKLGSPEESDEKVGRLCHGWRLQEQWQPWWGRRKSQGRKRGVIREQQEFWRAHQPCRVQRSQEEEHRVLKGGKHRRNKKEKRN